jgi:hypothetical protein
LERLDLGDIRFANEKIVEEAFPLEFLEEIASPNSLLSCSALKTCLITTSSSRRSTFDKDRLLLAVVSCFPNIHLLRLGLPEITAQHFRLIVKSYSNSLEHLELISGSTISFTWNTQVDVPILQSTQQLRTIKFKNFLFEKNKSFLRALKQRISIAWKEVQFSEYELTITSARIQQNLFDVDSDSLPAFSKARYCTIS